MKRLRIVMFVVGALVVGIALRYTQQKLSPFGSIAGHTAPLTQPVPAVTRALRPNYPYSIIPGGVYSTAELRSADRDDPVVQEHYADFSLKNARMVQLTEDKYQYASYRVKDKVFWTKKKLRIPKGELLLTDGPSYARARCGNRLSDKPQKPVREKDPPLKELTMTDMTLGTPMVFAAAPPVGELSSLPPIDTGKYPPVMPPSYAVPGDLGPDGPIMPVVTVGLTPLPGFPTATPPGGGPTGAPPTLVPPPTTPVLPPDNQPPVTSVPEPNALYLFVITFIVSLYGLTRMMRDTEVKDSQEDHKTFE